MRGQTGRFLSVGAGIENTAWAIRGWSPSRWRALVARLKPCPPEKPEPHTSRFARGGAFWHPPAYLGL